MNAAHLHLVIVHVPIVITPLALVILIFGVLTKRAPFQQLAYLLLVVCALAAAASSWTGEGAEGAVEHLAGVSERTIENHEEAADVAIWLCAASGLLAAGALFLRSHKAAQLLSIVIVLVTSVASIGLGYTGYLGGKIRHSETSTSSPASLSGEHDDDD